VNPQERLKAINWYAQKLAECMNSGSVTPFAVRYLDKIHSLSYDGDGADEGRRHYEAAGHYSDFAFWSEHFGHKRK